MATWMGQNFQMTLDVTETKGGEPVTRTFSLKLPYAVDGIVINLPGLLAGLPPEAYQTVFVPQPDAAPAEEIIPEEELVPGDI